MSRRLLGPDELDLWQEVAAKAKPLQSKKSTVIPVKIAPQRAVKPLLLNPDLVAPARLRVKAFENGQLASAPASVPSERITIAKPYTQPPIQMDQKAYARLKRGKIAPEARIDLHGMTSQEAHPQLICFILRAFNAGNRLVLVITGKGKPGEGRDIIPRQTGVLKQKVPHWLRLAPISSVVLEVANAHIKHGGGGALYVYLRRKR